MSNSLRVDNRAALHTTIEEVLRKQPVSYWVGHLQACGVPAAPINDIAQALASPQVQARNMVVHAEDPVLGTVGLVGNPLKMSAFEDPPTRRITPDLDQDRERLLAEFGLTPGQPARRGSRAARG